MDHRVFWIQSCLQPHGIRFRIGLDDTKIFQVVPFISAFGAFFIIQSRRIPGHRGKMAKYLGPAISLDRVRGRFIHRGVLHPI